MVKVEVVGPDGRHDRESLGAQVAGQEGEQVAGRRVGPVEVLDDEDDGGRGAEPPEQAEEPLEDPALEPVAPRKRGKLRLRPVGQLGDEPGELGRRRPDRVTQLPSRDLGDQRPEDLDDRAERQAVVAERDAAPGQDQRVGPSVGADPGHELGDQAALADPGLAVDQRERRLTVGGRRDGRLELCELRAATDEDRAGDAT